MKVVVSGSRGIDNANYVVNCIENSGFDITELIVGDARGVDVIAARWAASKRIPYKIVPAQWDEFEKMGNRKAAGPARNRKMVIEGDAVIAIWDGESRGTSSTIEIARKMGKPIKVWTLLRSEDKVTAL